MVIVLASAQPAWAQFAASFTMTSSVPDPVHVYPLAPITVEVWDTQGYGTTIYDNSISRIQLNWNASTGFAVTGGVWTWGSALAGLVDYVDSDMTDGIVGRINAGDGIVPGAYFSVGTLALTAPAYNSVGGNTHTLSLTGGSYDDETLTVVACGSPSPIPGEPGGVQLLAPPSGKGLTLAGYNVTVIPGGKWTGGSSTAWQSPGNWSSAMAPGPTFEAVFDGPPVANQPALGQSESASSLLFKTAGWTISGSGLTLTVGAGGISSSGTGTNTVNPTVKFTGNASVSMSPNNTVALAAIDVGANSLAKSGAGTLVLAGAGVCGGGTTISEGTLLVNNTTESGTGTGAVTVGAATLGGTGFINGPVTLTGDSTLTSIGMLTINNTLTIQGLANQLSSGTVVTTDDVTIEPGAVFIINGTLGGGTGDLIVRGTLMGKGTINKSCVIEAGGVLSPGEPSTIQGMSQILNAQAPRNFSFEIGAASPNYANPTNSVNDVVRLTDSAKPFADATGTTPAALTQDTVIDVYFLFNDLPQGRYKAEFFAATDFADAVADATLQYWRLDPRGSLLHNGNFFSPLEESLVDWSVVPETAAFAGGEASGYITEFTVAPEPASAVLLAMGGAVLLRRRMTSTASRRQDGAGSCRSLGLATGSRPRPAGTRKRIPRKHFTPPAALT